MVFGAFHPHSYLKGILCENGEDFGEVLVDALVKVRAGPHTNCLGITVAQSPRHVPWVWCEHALMKKRTEKGDGYFLYLTGSRFPSHSLFLNGERILEISSDPLEGNTSDEALTKGAETKDTGLRNPGDDGAEGPVDKHRYTVSATQYKCLDVTDRIVGRQLGVADESAVGEETEACEIPVPEPSPDEEEERREERRRGRGRRAGRTSSIQGAGAAARMRVGQIRPVVDPPELVTCPPQGGPWDGKGEIQVLSPPTRSLAVGGAGVFPDRLEFSIIGCSDGRCNGMGSIEPEHDRVRVNGKNVLLETDKGSCSGMMIPPTGPPVTCRCEVSFKEKAE